jgi:hypothetical protein
VVYQSGGVRYWTWYDGATHYTANTGRIGFEITAGPEPAVGAGPFIDLNEWALGRFAYWLAQLWVRWLG